jgi:hypothetical protein
MEIGCLCVHKPVFKKPFQLYTSFLCLLRLWIISMYNDCVGETWQPVYLQTQHNHARLRVSQQCCWRLKFESSGMLNHVKNINKNQYFVQQSLNMCQPNAYAVSESHCSITFLTLQTVNSTPCKEYYRVRSVITQSGCNLPRVWRKLLLSSSRNPLPCILRQQVPLKCW